MGSSSRVSRSDQPPRFLLRLESLFSQLRGAGGRFGETFLSLVALRGYNVPSLLPKDL